MIRMHVQGATPLPLVLAGLLAPASLLADLPAGPLTVGEALARALEADPTLQVRRLDPEIARMALSRDLAAWDPIFDSELSWDDQRHPSATQLDGAPIRQSNARAASVGVRKPLHGGGSLETNLSQRRDETNSSFRTINPGYRTGVQVTYRQPLSRGRRIDQQRRARRLSELSYRQSRWSLRQSLLETLASTERAYWTLAAARRQRQVARLSLDQAVRLLEANQEKVRAGALAPIDVVEAEAAVTERQAALVQAERNLDEADDALLRRIDPPPQPEKAVGLLANLPGDDLPPAPGHQDLLAQAMESSPAYRLGLLELEAEEVEVTFAKDAVHPRLDLVTTLESNGLGPGSGDAIDQSISTDFPRYFVGLSFELPLGRRAAHAEHRRRRLLLERKVREVKASELAIEGDVEAALQRYRHDLTSMRVARSRVEAAERKLAAEEDRYEEGLITADDLLRFQRELAEARSSEVSARAQASRSALELWVISGTLPERRGVSLDELGLAARSG